MRNASDRGQLATVEERNRMEDIIWELEVRTPIDNPATSEALEGRWALVYASEDPTRSSPFFWAFRHVIGLKHGVSYGSNRLETRPLSYEQLADYQPLIPLMVLYHGSQRVYKISVSYFLIKI